MVAWLFGYFIGAASNRPEEKSIRFYVVCPLGNIYYDMNYTELPPVMILQGNFSRVPILYYDRLAGKCCLINATINDTRTYMCWNSSFLACIYEILK